VDATCFQFEHTAAGQFVEVQVDIYTTSGRLVRSLRHEGVADGFRFGNDDCIAWDGTDMFGQELARGVYLYKVKLQTEDAERSGESGFERLVVLK
jgi:flagellar hook assembly protein FlgD